MITLSLDQIEVQIKSFDKNDYRKRINTVNLETTIRGNSVVYGQRYKTKYEFNIATFLLNEDAEKLKLMIEMHETLRALPNNISFPILVSDTSNCIVEANPNQRFSLEDISVANGYKTYYARFKTLVREFQIYKHNKTQQKIDLKLTEIW
jgi:hypothetical protein